MVSVKIFLQRQIVRFKVFGKDFHFLNPVRSEKSKFLSQTTPGDQIPVFRTQYGKRLDQSVRFSSLLIDVLNLDKVVIGQCMLQIRQVVTIPFLMDDLFILRSIGK